MTHAHSSWVPHPISTDHGVTLHRFRIQGCLAFLCLASSLCPCQAADGWTAVPEPKAVAVVTGTPDKPQLPQTRDAWSAIPEPKSVVVAASVQVGKAPAAPPAPSKAAVPPPVAAPLGDALPKGGPRPVLESVAEDMVSSISEAALPMTLDPQRSKIVVMKRPVARISITDPKVLEVVQYSPRNGVDWPDGRASQPYLHDHSAGRAGRGSARYLVESSRTWAENPASRVQTCLRSMNCFPIARCLDPHRRQADRQGAGARRRRRPRSSIVRNQSQGATWRVGRSLM